MPKPMVPILGEPVLVHILRLLRKNGVTDACLALRYMPRVVIDYFGDEFEGVSLTHRVEGERRGTAGCVRDCADFIGGDGDFLVVSGDCICDFDFRELIRFHRSRKSEVTIALHAVPEPTEYGLVVCSPDGKIEKFTEKPAWEGVMTDMVSTGIYVITASALREIPESGEYDFGCDLFPALLESGRALYAVAPRGYWRDIGSPDSYYACVRDAEDGRVRLEASHSAVSHRITASETSNEGAQHATPLFTARGEISGGRDARLDASVCLRLGLAAGGFGLVGICCAGGAAARVVSRLIADGVNAAGGDVITHDAETLAEAAFAARTLDIALSAVVTQRGGDIKISFIDKTGAAIGRAVERRLLSPPPDGVGALRFSGQAHCGESRSVTGVVELYISHLARIARVEAPDDAAPLRVAVGGGGSAARALREALTRAGGYELAEEAQGCVIFEPSPDGRACSARGERGAPPDFGELLAMAAAIHFESSRGALTLPPDAPEAINALAAKYKGELIRSDINTAEWSRDGLVLAAELCAFMRRRGVSFDEIKASIPRFRISELEIPLRSDRAAVMRELSSNAEAGDMLDSGLVLRGADGFALISPRRATDALHIRAETPGEANARQLLAELTRRIRESEDRAIINKF
jgi:NDP-sugar pyrophosphorylase family protein